MHIVALAWIYVVLMMAITEHSIVAGVMTFLFYGVVPLSIILYLMNAAKRKLHRGRLEKMRRQTAADESADPS